jgi:hypothetical protein
MPWLHWQETCSWLTQLTIASTASGNPVTITTISPFS